MNRRRQGLPPGILPATGLARVAAARVSMRPENRGWRSRSGAALESANAGVVGERSLHVPVEEGDDLFRMPSEVVVSVLEASRGALDPEQFLVFACQQVEGLLRVLRVPRPGVIQNLD